MQGALVFSWGSPVRGREAKGYEVFGRALAYYDQLAKEGRIQGHRAYFSLTGRGAGMLIVDGEVEELLRLEGEPAARDLRMEALSIVEDFDGQVFAGGSEGAVTELVGRQMELQQGLGIL